MSSSYIYFPSASLSRPAQTAPRFFFTIDAVLANFTTLAAQYLDDLQLPYTNDGLFEENMLQKHFVPEVLFDICHGREFWENVPVYDWSWLMFEKAYALSSGDVHFVGKAYMADPGSWAGKAAWVHKNFGKYGVERLAMSLSTDNLVLLNNGRQDILVSCIKRDVELWNNAGGSALYFQELDVRSPKCAAEVANRLIAMEDIVIQLNS
jgi:hypothetical protein